MHIRSFQRAASRIRACLLLLVALLVGGSALLGLPAAHAANTLFVFSCPNAGTLSQDIASVGAGGFLEFLISNSQCDIALNNVLGITQDLTLDASQSQKTVTLDGRGATMVIDVAPSVKLTLKVLSELRT